MQTAFKEWTVIVDALEKGDQILILRKGGIREGKAGFQVEANDFWLFPTQFHQQRDAVIERAQHRFDQIHRSDDADSSVSIRSCAKIVESHEIDSWETIVRLEPLHVWKPETIRERFDWGKRQGIFAMIVRVFQLASSIEVPMVADYGGCKSWIKLEPSLPDDSLSPVLDDTSFAQKLAEVQSLING